MLTTPFVLLVGQVFTFFVISLYVKLAEMRATTEYGATWLGPQRFARNSLAFALFSGQEICLFAALLVALAVWRAHLSEMGLVWRSVAWTLGLFVLPLLSLVEVFGLAHFAYFLTPLGPEEVRQIAWARHLVSASNVLDSPDVAIGVLLVVLSYYLAPCGLWFHRAPGWRLWKPPALAAIMGLGILAVSAPKPIVADALLAPHPVLWLLVGGRTTPVWAASLETIGGERSTGRDRFGRAHLAVRGRPKNVLLFVLESTRAQSLAVYNEKAPVGRELLRWRNEMVVFDQVYAPVPTSAHAIFSMLYGVYPYLGPFWMTNGKTVVAGSLAEYFTRAGYASHLYVTSDLDFDNVRSFAAPGFERVLDPNDWPGQEAFAMLPWGRDDRLLLEEVKRFLTARDGRPFFLFAMTSNPHHPYTTEHLAPIAAHVALAANADDESQANYERLVDYNLHLLAELYDWMKQRKIADDTLLLVLGDHGEAFGEHPGNYGHAAFIYEENVHIPCFILHPHRLGLPQHIAQLGSQVDLRATILDILGLPDSEPGDGMSLLREDPERLIAHFTENGVSHFGLRDTRFSYIYTPHVEVEQVFDRRSDPQELHDLAAQDQTTTARYRARLQRWEAQHQLSLARILR